MFCALLGQEHLQDHWSSGHFLVPESFHKNLVQIGKVVSEKIWFEFCMYTTLGQGQEMTLTFNTHIPSYI